MKPSYLLGALLPLGALGASVLQVNPNVANLDEQSSMKNDWDWNDCSVPEEPVKITSIKINPDPPEAGKNLTVTVGANVLERIEEGAYVNVVVKFGLIKLPEQNFDLCEEARKAEAEVQCPVEEGEYTIEQTAKLPAVIPPGKITVAVRGYTNGDENLGCVDIEVNFRPKILHF